MQWVVISRKAESLFDRSGSKSMPALGELATTGRPAGGGDGQEGTRARLTRAARAKRARGTNPRRAAEPTERRTRGPRRGRSESARPRPRRKGGGGRAEEGPWLAKGPLLRFRYLPPGPRAARLGTRMTGIAWMHGYAPMVCRTLILPERPPVLVTA